MVARVVTPEYFRVLNIPILEGRGFTEEERSAKGDFMILSRRLAEWLFPKGNAVGQTACTKPATVTTAWALLCSANPGAPSQLVAGLRPLPVPPAPPSPGT